MKRHRIQISVCALAAAVALSACGCGNGMLAFDDVEPWSCALGPTPPLQIQNVPSRDFADRAKIYLLRGFQNDYSLGFDRLAEEMRAANIEPTIVAWPLWEPAARRIVDDFAGRSDGSAFMLVGHSYGADDAIRIAQYMKQFGMKVDLLFLMDATSPDPIPDNVVRCIHYYNPWLPGFLAPDIFSGNPVVPEEGNTTTDISNRQFNREALGDGVGCADHFSMDANQLMHNFVIEEALRLMPQP